MARGFQSAALVVATALALSSFAAAQNNVTASRVGSGPTTTSQSQQMSVAGNGGCSGFTYEPTLNGSARSPGFNYSSFLGLPTVLPEGCTTDNLQITKQYTYNSCPNTRDNNYAVPSLGRSNTCSDEISTASSASCNNVISQAPNDAFATKGIGLSDEVDSGNVCWEPPYVYYFVKNSCATAFNVTIKVTFDTYAGSCADAGDTDDGGDDAGGAGSKNDGGGLSGGAKAGIAIGVIIAVILIAVAAWFFCCQLRKG